MTKHHEERDGRSCHWWIERCPEGCVHLHLEHTTMSFSAAEFAALRTLLEQAAAAWERDAAASARTH
jgi:hypothetical protein